jgi:Uri superfamily endonuclease
VRLETISNQGTYALILSLNQNSNIEVGSLGIISFITGFYVYVGSAFGSGGLRARLAHHLLPMHRPNWHIDYLRMQANILNIWFTCDPIRREHAWACVFPEMKDALVPILGFGASDCNCPSHLFYFQSMPDSVLFSIQLQKHYPGHQIVQHVLPNLVISQK